MKTKQIKLTVRKLDVYNEVAKTTAYAGAKQLDDDEHAYDRVFTTDEDRLMLERYFGEASREIVSNLPTSYIVEVCDYNTGTGIDLHADYKLTLEIPEAFPDALTGSVEATMSFFFTTYIVSQWLLPLGSLVFVLFCTYKFGWGWENFLNEANEGKGLKVRSWMKLYMQIVLPIVLIVIFILGII